MNMSSLKSKYDESRKALIFMSLNYIHSKKVCCIKNSGSIIISIANGFLCPEGQYITPGIEFIDIYRGFDMVKNCQRNFVIIILKILDFFLQM